MTERRLTAILDHQMPDREKRRRADFVVPTGLSRNLSSRRLRAIVRLLTDNKARIVQGNQYALAARQRRR